MYDCCEKVPFVLGIQKQAGNSFGFADIDLDCIDFD